MKCFKQVVECHCGVAPAVDSQTEGWKMSSYFSERTVEYSIVPPLVDYLTGRFGNAVPMFFWRSREGNSCSAKRHADAIVRVLAVFARRPKESRREGELFGKLNGVLHEFAESAVPVGIPCFVGFPFAETLFDLGRSPTFWFPIPPDRDGDFRFSVTVRGEDGDAVGLDGRLSQQSASSK